MPRKTDGTESSPIIREIKAKSILTRSGIGDVDYCVNPYVGCEHACRYCYATFICKYTGHTERWGSFLDVRVNAPELLVKELKRKRPGRVMVSSVTDAYQPAETRYKLTRRCLEAFLEWGWKVRVLTKSALVVRDKDIFKNFKEIEVGLTVTTDDESVRRVMEPHASSIAARLRALDGLTSAGIHTYAFVGPVLPMDPSLLARMIHGRTEEVILDRMNYPWKVRWVYERFGWQRTLTEACFDSVKGAFADVFGGRARVCEPEKKEA